MAKKTIAIDVKYDGSDVDKGVKNTTTNVKNLEKQSDKTSKEMQKGFKSVNDVIAIMPAPIAAAARSMMLMGGNIKKVIVSMKALKFAIAATGIGALVIAVGTLVSYFTRTQRGADKINQVFKTVGATVDVLIDRVSSFGEGLFEILSGNFSKGAEILKNALKGVGDEIDRESKAALQLEKDMQALQDREIEFIKVKAEKQRAIENARLAAEDEGKSDIERANALREAIRIQNELTDEQIEIAKEQARIIRERVALGESTREDLEEQARAEARVIELETERDRRLRSVQTRLNAFTKATEESTEAIKEETKAKEENNDADKEAERLLELEEMLRDARIALIADDKEREIAQAEANLEERLERIQGDSEIEQELRASLTEINEQEIAAIKDKYRIQEEAKKEQSDKRILAQEEQAANARIKVAQSMGSILGSVASMVQNMGEEGATAAKVLAVAQIAIDTAVAISGAIAQAQSVPFPGNIAAIATGVAAVVAGIANATQILNSADVAGPSAAPPSASTISTAAPTVNPVTTNTTELGNTEQAELAPVQAYVVETEITGNQENIGQIEGQAEFGTLGG